MFVEQESYYRKVDNIRVVHPLFFHYYDRFLSSLKELLGDTPRWSVDDDSFKDGTEWLQVIPDSGTIQDIREGQLAKTSYVPFWIVPPIKDSLFATSQVLNALTYSTESRPPLVERTIGVAPYIEVRQDKDGVDEDSGEQLIGEAINAKLIANTLAANGLQELEYLELHSYEAAQMLEQAGIRCLPLTAANLHANELKDLNNSRGNPLISENTALVALDKGSLQKNLKLAQLLGLDPFTQLIILNKHKRGHVTIDQSTLLWGNPEGKDIIIYDDILDTSQSIGVTCEQLKKAGCGSITLVITQAILSIPARRKIESLIKKGIIDRIILTDSLPKAAFRLENLVRQAKVIILPVVPLLAKYAKLIQERGIDAIIADPEFQSDILIPKKKEEVWQAFKRTAESKKEASENLVEIYNLV